jgi:hypothetical protein
MVRYAAFLSWVSLAGTALCSIAASSRAVDPSIPAPVALGGVLNFDTDDTPEFSADGNTVFFDRNPGPNDKQVMIAHRVNGVWSKPEVAPFSGHWFDQNPVLSPDDSYVLFNSDRPVRPGGKSLVTTFAGKPHPGSNIWRVDRKGSGWGEPRWLGPLVNSDVFIDFPDIVADGSIYFMRRDQGALHFFRSQFKDGEYLPARRVAIGDPTVPTHDAAVAPDESFMIFDFGKVKNGLGRLCIAFRIGDHWSAPLDLGDTANHDIPWGSRLSRDQRTVYFTGATKIWELSLEPWLSRKQ